jgi:DNA-binding response OmpR family regulator
MPRGSVLILDQPEVDCKSLAGPLQKEGIKLACATRTDEALDLLRNCSFDVMLVNIHLDDVDSLELAGKLRGQCPAMQIAFLGHTNPTPELLIKAMRAGVCDFFLKPYDFPFLLNRINALLELGLNQRSKDACIEQVYGLLDQMVNNGNGGKNGKEQAEPIAITHRGNAGLVQVGALTADPQARTISMNGKEILLSNTNFDYLLVLLRHAPRPVTFASLVFEAQGYELSKAEAKSLAFWHIHKLRREVSDLFGSNLIENIRGMGYRITQH